MAEKREPVRIAINVMRARLTVVAFNLAIITFQLGVLPRLPGAVRLTEAGTPLHLGTDITLLIGLGLCIIAMVSFLMSGELDEQGACTHWSLLVGDLFMYLGLAHSVSGFFGPTINLLGYSVMSATAEIQQLESLRVALIVTGGTGWFLATYVGPAVSLLRSPFTPRVTLSLAIAYLALLALVAYVSRQAFLLEAALSAKDASAATTLLHEFLQPLRW
jgi:hypothetical protein